MFEGSIAKGQADAGETVRVEAHDGRFLAWGAYSPRSTIRVRAWSFDEAERIDAAFFARRIAARGGAARAAGGGQRRACAWCTARPTACPGWWSTATATRWCAQFLSAGAERWKDAIADALLPATGTHAAVRALRPGVRELEGLPERQRLAARRRRHRS